jgi:DNA-binding CsgD family transcriptional regulator
MPAGVAAPAAPVRPEVLGTHDSAKGWRAAVMLGVCCALSTALVLCGEAAAADGTPPWGTAAVLAAVCAGALAFVLGTQGAPRSFSLTSLFRVVFPPLGCAVLIEAFAPSWSLAAVGVGVWAQVGMGFASMGIGAALVRSGGGAGAPYGMGAGPSVCRVVAFQALGAAAALALVPVGMDAGGVLVPLLACSVVAMVAFVECVPAFEPRFVGAASARPAPHAGGGAGLAENRYAPLVEHYGLTARESEVFSLLLDGSDAHGVSEALQVSRATVNSHIQHIYAKLGVHSRSELVARVGVVEGK